MAKAKFTSNKLKIFEAHTSLKKIRDFNSNDELKPLIDIVGKWRFYIGIREELSQEELFMNINFIRENFNELNIIDINQAINLSLKGELDIDVEHYQNFTPLYISKILKAYKIYKGKVMYEIRNQLSKVENEPKEPTKNEKLEITKSSLYSMFQQRNDEQFYDYGGVTYDFIKKNNLMLFSEGLVKEAMDYGNKENLKGKRDSAYKDVVLGTSKNLTNAREKQQSNIRASARNYVVKKWLKKYDEDEFIIFLKNINVNMI